MKVKMIKALVNKDVGMINKGEVLSVRLLRKHPFDYMPEIQVIEGCYSGVIVPYTHFTEIKEEKTFTGAEVQSIENVHLARLEKELNEIRRLKSELHNTKILNSKLTEKIMFNDIYQLLFEWLESDCGDISESEDRRQFVKKLVNYLSNVQQT